MKIKLGNSDISDIRLGSNQISAVYVGDTKIFPESTLVVEPVSFTSNAAQTLSMTNASSPNIQYSYNKTDWTTWNYGSLSFGTGSNTTLYIRGYNPNGFSKTNYKNNFHFGTSAPVAVSGNVMSLINYTASTLTIPNNDCFNIMFYQCSAITTVSADFLPATTLKTDCYRSMFNECYNLTTTPDLPATTMVEGCYKAMFRVCRSLTTAPALCATTLANECYLSMFHSCTGLTTVPYLSNAPLQYKSYDTMFSNCSNLNEIHCSIPTANAAYSDRWVSGVSETGDFYCVDAGWTIGVSGIPCGWTIHYINAPEPVSFTASEAQTLSMTNATSPNLQYSYDKINWTTWDYNALSFGTGSNTTLYIRGYNTGGFTITGNNVNNFTFGTSAPVAVSGDVMSLINYKTSTLTIPNDYCFNSLFSGATAISTVSEDFLPATNLLSRCYMHMFIDCSNLTTVPDLPATTMYTNCYLDLFRGCTSLTAVPYDLLPATTMVEGCYANMFMDCTNLTNAPNLPATALSLNCMYNMFRNCSKINEIHTSALAATSSTQIYAYDWVYGVSGSGDFYCYSTAGWKANATSGIPSNWTVYYKDTTPMAVEPVIFSANTAQTLRFVNANSPNLQYTYNKDGWRTWNYTSSDSISFGTGKHTTLYVRGYNPNGFSSASSLNYFQFGTNNPSTNPVSVSGNIMSLINYTASTVTIPNDYCFNYIFYGCRAMTGVSADFLPATGLTDSCYKQMFLLCSGLENAPELPALSAPYCSYQQMFCGCTSLTEVTTISATSFGNYACNSMFHTCTSLIKAPELPAEITLPEGCYSFMFKECTNLNEIHCNATNISATLAVTGWVDGVQTSSGNFYGKSAAGWSTGVNGIPSNWTQHLT